VKRLSEQSLYEILEVPPSAAPAEIESAYARARELDAPGSLATYSLMAPEDAVALAERIEEAKRVLLDPDARARYDAGLTAAEGVAAAAGRIASTGTGAVAAGPQRPYLVGPQSPAPVRTPAPAARPVESAKAEQSAAARREERREEAADEGSPAASPAPVSLPPIAPPVAVAPPAPAAGPIQLKNEVQAEAQGRDMPVPEGAVWSGEALRRVRESRGLTVRQVCDRTKVSRYHLENIEADRFKLLPASVYLRGILLTVARELRLDGQKVARSYLDRMGDGSPQPR
jgi:hypothetical protein